jgi:hypothetical protein
MLVEVADGQVLEEEEDASAASGLLTGRVVLTDRNLGSPLGPLHGPAVVFQPARHSLAEFWAEREAKPSHEPWRLSYALATRGECRLLQTLLEDQGFVLTTARSFNLLWLNCQVKPALLLSLNKYQKVNHFPRTHELTRKDLLVRTLTAMREAHGPGACDFLPATFVLPADAEACHAAMSRERCTWIVKPINSSRGRGISIVQASHQVPQEDVVVSRYIANPLLIECATAGRTQQRTPVADAAVLSCRARRCARAAASSSTCGCTWRSPPSTRCASMSTMKGSAGSLRSPTRTPPG